MFVISNKPSVSFTSLQARRAEFIEAGTHEALLAVVPTGRLVRASMDYLADEVHKRHGMPLDYDGATTFDSMVLRVAEHLYEADGVPRVLGKPWQNAIFKEAAESCELSFFATEGHLPGQSLIDELANTVVGLKEDGIRPEHFLAEIERHITTGESESNISKMRDLAELYRRYEELLEESGLTDPPGLLLKVNALLNGRADLGALLDGIFSKTTDIVVDQFTTFTAEERRFLSLLGKGSFRLDILIDYSPSNGPLFADLEETVSGLMDLGLHGFPEHGPVEEAAQATSLLRHARPTTVFRHFLFNTSDRILHDTDDEEVARTLDRTAEGLYVMSASTRIDEVRAICAVLKHWLVEEEVPPASVAVVMRSPELYTPLFREFGRLAGLPLNVTDRWTLSHSPVVIAIFAALEVAAEQGGIESVEKAVLNPFLSTGIPDEELRILLGTVRRWRLHTRRFCSIRTWHAELGELLERQNKRVARLQHNELRDEDERREAERDAEMLRRACEASSRLAEAFPVLPRRCQPADFARYVSETLLHRLKVRSQVLAFHDKALAGTVANTSLFDSTEVFEEVEKDARALTTFMRVIKTQTAIAEERYPEKTWRTAELIAQLRTVVESEKYQTREKPGFGITITSIEQIRGLAFSHLVLCGAVDGEFPMSYQTRPFLGHELKETEERFLKRERLQFYQVLVHNTLAVDQGRRRLLITLPRSDSDATTVQSSFLPALQLVVDIPEHRRIALGEAIDPRVEPWLRAPLSICDVASFMRGAAGAATRGSAKLWIEAAERHGLAHEVSQLVASLYPGDRTRVAVPPRVVHEIQSASALEKWIDCPFASFARRELLLPEPMRYTEEPLGNERGVLMHAIARDIILRAGELCAVDQVEPLPEYAHLPVLRPARLTLLPLGGWMDIAEEIVEKHVREGGWDHPFYRVATQEIRSSIRYWLRGEYERSGSAHILPAAVELGFGARAGSQPSSVAPAVTLAESLTLRGKIDRVDVHVNPDGSLAVVIMDYKTTSAPSGSDIENADRIQIQLYAKAIEEILEQCYGRQAYVFGFAWILFAPKEATPVVSRFIPVEVQGLLGLEARSRDIESVDELRGLIDKAVERSSQTATAMQNGQWDVSPREDSTCTYCAYKSVCRMRSLKLAGKI